MRVGDDDADGARPPGAVVHHHGEAVEQAPGRHPLDVEPARVLAHRHRGAEPGGHRRQQPGGVVDDRRRHAEAAVQHLDVAVGLAEVAQRRRPRVGRPRRRALGDVAEHRRRAGGAPPPDRPQLHRREVLRLVEHDVARGSGCARGGRRSSSSSTSVGGRPPGAATATAAATSTAAGAARPSSSSPSAAAAERGGVGEQLEQHRRGGRAPARPSPAYRRTAADRATASCTRSSGESPAAPSRSSTACASRCGSICRAGVVADAARAQLVQDLAAPRTPARATCAPRAARPGPRSPRRTCDHTARSQHGGQPRVALEHSGLARCRRRGRAPPATQLLDGRVADLDLAERRQHRADVVEEGAVRADDEDAGRGQPVAERVEQPRRAVQPDRGLAGARRALDADRRRRVGPDDHVLLGLDGGDDVAHRPDAGAFDLAGEDVAGAGHLASGAARCSSSYAVSRPRSTPNRRRRPHAHRGGPRGPVERAGQLGPPVDDDRVAGGVATCRRPM